MSHAASQRRRAAHGTSAAVPAALALAAALALLAVVALHPWPVAATALAVAAGLASWRRPSGWLVAWPALLPLLAAPHGATDAIGWVGWVGRIGWVEPALAGAALGVLVRRALWPAASRPARRPAGRSVGPVVAVALSAWLAALVSSALRGLLDAMRVRAAPATLAEVAAAAAPMLLALLALAMWRATVAAIGRGAAGRRLGLGATIGLALGAAAVLLRVAAPAGWAGAVAALPGDDESAIGLALAAPFAVWRAQHATTRRARAAAAAALALAAVAALALGSQAAMLAMVFGALTGAWMTRHRHARRAAATPGDGVADAPDSRGAGPGTSFDPGPDTAGGGPDSEPEDTEPVPPQAEAPQPAWTRTVLALGAVAAISLAGAALAASVGGAGAAAVVGVLTMLMLPLADALRGLRLREHLIGLAALTVFVAALLLLADLGEGVGVFVGSLVLAVVAGWALLRPQAKAGGRWLNALAAAAWAAMLAALPIGALRGGGGVAVAAMLLPAGMLGASLLAAALPRHRLWPDSGRLQVAVAAVAALASLLGATIGPGHPLALTHLERQRVGDGGWRDAERALARLDGEGERWLGAGLGRLEARVPPAASASASAPATDSGLFDPRLVAGTPSAAASAPAGTAEATQAVRPAGPAGPAPGSRGAAPHIAVRLLFEQGGLGVAATLALMLAAFASLLVVRRRLPWLAGPAAGALVGFWLLAASHRLAASSALWGFVLWLALMAATLPIGHDRHGHGRTLRPGGERRGGRRLSASSGLRPTPSHPRTR